MRRVLLIGALLLVFGLGRISSAVGSSPTRGGFSRLASLIQKHYWRTERLGLLEEGAMRGMVAVLGDPYSTYFSPREMERFRSQSAGRLYGAGLRLERRDGGYFLRPLPNSPAARAGIRDGDRLVSLGGRPVSDLSPFELWQLLRGRPAEALRIGIKRGNRSLQLVVRRGPFRLPLTESRWVAPGVGYLRLYLFGPGASRQVAERIAAFKRKPFRALILDLRDDPGGLLDQALAIGKQFLPKGPLVTVESRQGRTAYHSPGPGLRRPIIVLVNGGTASAAELLAGAIQDDGAGYLVGERTFGKGLVQRIFPLPGGAGVKLTVARYLTPRGRFINGIGLKPDVPAPSDRALAVAEEVLQR